MPAGSYSVTAQATDNGGATTTSAAVAVTVEEDTGETITYIHTDVSGSPLAATNANGNVVWKENYRAYGERQLEQPGSEGQGQWFHGKEADATTGLQYFGARYYDPAVGRFMGVDPVGFQEDNLHSFNRYAYGNNNPVKYLDPDGMQAQEQVWNVVFNTNRLGFGADGREGFRAAVAGIANGYIEGMSYIALVAIGGPEFGTAKALMGTAGVAKTAATEATAVTKISFGARATKNSATQLNVDLTQTQAIDNLAANGFSKALSKDGTVTIMNKGEKTYRFYPFSTGGGVAGAESGVPSASVSVMDKIVTKLRFLGE